MTRRDDHDFNFESLSRIDPANRELALEALAEFLLSAHAKSEIMATISDDPFYRFGMTVGDKGIRESAERAMRGAVKQLLPWRMDILRKDIAIMNTIHESAEDLYKHLQAIGWVPKTEE